MLAANSQAKNGLGNDNDQVGRYFMEHLEIKGSELWMSHPESLKFYLWNWGTPYRAELAIHESKQREFNILNGTASFLPLAVARNQPSFMEVWTDDERKNQEAMKAFGAAKADLHVPEGFEAYELFTRMEQAPNPNSRIILNKERDALGVLRSHLHWEFTALEKKSLRKIHELIGLELGRRANSRVQLLEYLRDPDDASWPVFTSGGWHNMGTTRMSDDPTTGVVDKNCKVFGIDNLYVAGSSCFATAGAANPTLTLVALSLRLSDHLKSRIA